MQTSLSWENFHVLPDYISCKWKKERSQRFLHFCWKYLSAEALIFSFMQEFDPWAQSVPRTCDSGVHSYAQWHSGLDGIELKGPVLLEWIHPKAGRVWSLIQSHWKTRSTREAEDWVNILLWGGGDQAHLHSFSVSILPFTTGCSRASFVRNNFGPVSHQWPEVDVTNRPQWHALCTILIIWTKKELQCDSVYSLPDLHTHTHTHLWTLVHTLDPPWRSLAQTVDTYGPTQPSNTRDGGMAKWGRRRRRESKQIEGERPWLLTKCPTDVVGILPSSCPMASRARASNRGKRRSPFRVLLKCVRLVWPGNAISTFQVGRTEDNDNNNKECWMFHS